MGRMRSVFRLLRKNDWCSQAAEARPEIYRGELGRAFEVVDPLVGTDALLDKTLEGLRAGKSLVTAVFDATGQCMVCGDVCDDFPDCEPRNG